MCSLADGMADAASATASEDETSTCDDLDVCKKCRVAKSSVVLRKRDAYCSDCFLSACTHKFRATLGKHKAVRPGDRVLVAFGGSASSVALLTMIKDGLEETTSHKRLLLSQASVLIVDESGAFSLDRDARKAHTSEISQLALTSGMPVFVVPLERALDDGDVSEEEVVRVAPGTDIPLPPADAESRLRSTLDSVGDGTAKEALLDKLRRRLLVSCAKSLGFAKVFTAESATSLAVTLVAGIASGRGVNLQSDTGFADSRHDNVTIFRPLREFSKKEVAHFCSLRSLPEPYTAPAFSLKQDAHFSIEKLTEAFVLGLQEDFPGTVPTIFRTGDKLASAESLESESACCVLCSGQLDNGTEAPGSLQATLFSRLMSQKGAKAFDGNLEQALRAVQDLQAGRDATSSSSASAPEEESPCSNTSACSGSGLCQDGDGGCGSKNKRQTQATKQTMAPWLCYGCQLTVSRMDDSALPGFVVAEAERRSRRQGMKNAIQDFLL